ncbi:MAG TPA: M28 family peptidase [Gemmatimonadaceae bacterium]|nr:M28 family peptidase [Gemmatimonadaceae bacterium]
MSSSRTTTVLALGALLAGPALAHAQAAATRAAGAAPKPVLELPLKHTGKPTTAAITPADLMTRVYVYADDSLMGRQVGTEYNLKAAAYIEREVRRLGLVPAGEAGGYYQNIPLFSNYVDSSATTLRIGTEALVYAKDFLPIPRVGRTIPFDRAQVIYAGTNADSTTWPTAEAAAGKIVVIGVPAGASPVRGVLFSDKSRFAKAAAILVASLDRIPAQVYPQIAHSTALRADTVPNTSPTTILVTPRVVSLLFDSLKAGAVGQPIAGTVTLREERAPGRNVVAILPGSDPALKGQYVAIGAHNDHVGFNRAPADHDSVKAFMMVARPQGADSPSGTPVTADQSTRIRAVLDSLRKLRPARVDSIYNGADDDASGSMSVLEIAEAFAGARVKPKRSILFVWHTGEEAGLFGSEHYTDHPTVPRDSIVAQLNMDMVGRGGANDITGSAKEGGELRGGPGYVQLVGSRRLSTELGDLIEDVNKTNKLGLNFDYGIDANGHPQNIYCRSDHYMYARYGIPVVFFTTGGHSDYHQVTDEPQYLDYGRMAQVATLVHDSAVRIANLDHRVVVDKPKPDPKGRCVQ